MTSETPHEMADRHHEDARHDAQRIIDAIWSDVRLETDAVLSKALNDSLEYTIKTHLDKVLQLATTAWHRGMAYADNKRDARCKE